MDKKLNRLFTAYHFTAIIFLGMFSAFLFSGAAVAKPCVTAYTCDDRKLEAFVSKIELSASDIHELKRYTAAHRPVPVRRLYIYAVKSKKAGLEMIAPSQRSTVKKHGGTTWGYTLMLGTKIGTPKSESRNRAQSRKLYSARTSTRKVCFRNNKLTINCRKNQQEVGLLKGEDITSLAGKDYILVAPKVDLSKVIFDVLFLNY